MLARRDFDYAAEDLRELLDRLERLATIAAAHHTGCHVAEKLLGQAMVLIAEARLKVADLEQFQACS